MCFTLNEFNTPDVNWLHSIIPTFGSGFDISTLSPTSLPGSCSGSGSWDWYDTPWVSCATSIPFGPGFAYDGSTGLGCGGTANDGDPGNNYGDNGAPCPATTWCWNISTVTPSFTCPLINYNVQVNVYGDAESSNWTGPPTPPCIADAPLCVPGLENIQIVQTPNGCGCANLSATWNGPTSGNECGLAIEWTGPGGFSSNTLTNEACQSGVYNLTIGLGSCLSYEVTELVQIIGFQPSVDLTAEPSPVCAGNPITFSAVFSNPSDDATYEWTIDGETYTGQSVTVPATGNSLETANFSGFDSDGCFVEETINYIVLNIASADLTVSDTLICEGETITVEGNDDEVWDFGGATVLSGSGDGPYELSFPAAGEYTVILATENGVCTDTARQTIYVDPVPLPLALSCEVFNDDSIHFSWTNLGPGTQYELTLDGGTPFVVTDTAYGVGQLPNNTTLTLEVTTINNGACPNPPPVSSTCTAFDCPDGTVSIDQPGGSSCLDTLATPVSLSFTPAGLGTFTDTVWAGPGVSGSQFDPILAGAGEHEVILTVTDADGCPYRDTVVFEIIPLPLATFDLVDTVCVASAATLTYQGGTPPTEGIFDWDFGGAMASTLGNETYGLTFPAPGDYTIGLTVTAQGCPSYFVSQNIHVLDLPPVPAPGCGGGGIDSVSFNWLPVMGATGYSVSINGGAANVITGTSIGVGGLNEGETVSLTIFTIGDGSCGNSPDTTITCTAEACPELTVAIDTDPDFFCLGSDPGFHVLGIAQNSGAGTGTYVWDGPGVSNDTFYYEQAGLGTHEVIVEYTENFCTYGDTVSFSVFATPVADFTLSFDTVCVGEMITVTNEVAELPGAAYNYQFPGSDLVSATDYGPHQLSYSAAGTYNLSLTVVENGCSAQFDTTVVVIDPLVAPVISCDQVTARDSIVFFWTSVEPNLGYQLTLDGVVVDTVNTTTYTINNLTPDTALTLIVTALGAAPCGNGPASLAMSCATEACPTITLAPAADQTTFCLADGDAPVVLTATSNGGDQTGTFTWSGPGVSFDGSVYNFDPDLAGVGDHILSVAYEETAGCSASAELTINVYADPAAAFTLSNDDFCATDSTLVTYTGATGPDVSIDWDFDGATVTDLGGETYSLRWSTAGTYTISVDVSRNGCDSSAFAGLTVTEPLPPASVTCLEQQLTSVTFGWLDVPGNLGYQVTYAGVVDTVFTLDYEITGLTPEQEVGIVVVPLGPPPCGNGPAVTDSCAAIACPVIVVSGAADQQSFCLDQGTPTSVLLTASSSGGDHTGTFTWSGPGVIFDGTDYTFDPLLANIGAHDLIVTYVETAGCGGSDTLTMNVFAIPTADFTVAANEICEAGSTAVNYVGTASGQATYNWDFAGATVDDLGNESYLLSWPIAGTYAISLSVSEAGCSSTDTLEITVVEPLATPQPVCDSISLTAVGFSWPAVTGATGYRISINEGPTQTIADTFWLVTDLDENTSVSITVVAEGPAPCGFSEGGSVSCSSLACPVVSLTPTAPQSLFCTGQDTEVVFLDAAVTGDTGGMVSWSGPGVSQGSTGWVFDPVGLAPGDYDLTATYTRSVCSYEATLTMTVAPLPDAAFSSSATNTCSGTSVTLSLDAAPVTGASYDWDFAGGQVTDLGNQTYTVSWNIPGNYEITLDVDQNGCQSSNASNVVVEAPPSAGQAVGNLTACQNAGDVLDLGSQLVGADPGGSWNAVGATNAGLDTQTGQLTTSALPAGSYEYVYSVAGNVCPSDAVSVNVVIDPAPVADAGADQVLTCTMGMVSLNGSNSTGGAGLIYQWTGPDGAPLAIDGDSPIVEVAAPGQYTLTVTSEIGCTATATVLVGSETEVPVPQVELSNVSCFSAADGSILVTGTEGGIPPYRYSLNGGAATNTTFFTGLGRGEYSLRVTDDNGCFTEIFLGLNEPDLLSVGIELPDGDNTYDEGDRVTLRADISGGNTISSIQWEPDSLSGTGEGVSNTITFQADQSRTISVTVLDENGCRATDQTNILVRREREVYIPAAFSPNGDATNDVFTVLGDPDKIEEVEEFLVFDRWGETIFENYNFQPNEPAQGWDGNHRGEPLNPQVLVYHAVVRFRDGERKVFKGDITLIR